MWWQILPTVTAVAWSWAWRSRLTGLSDAVLRAGGRMHILDLLSCSFTGLILHPTHPSASSTSHSLKLSPLAELIFPPACYWPCCFRCLQWLSHLPSLEQPYSSLEAQIRHQPPVQSSLTCSLLLPDPKSRIKSFQPPCSYKSFQSPCSCVTLLEPLSHDPGERRVKVSPATLARGPYLCSLNFQLSLQYLAQRSFKKKCLLN